MIQSCLMAKPDEKQERLARFVQVIIPNMFTSGIWGIAVTTVDDHQDIGIYLMYVDLNYIT